MDQKNKRVYQFKITLQGTKPPIWRRIQVPESYSFLDLHAAIQDAMGWEGHHLHQFEIMNPKYGEEDFIGSPDSLGFSGVKVHPGWKVRISTYFASTAQAIYEYDFGDAWRHKVTLEKVLPLEPGTTYPRCLAGKRACPPEDCGGVWGYEELLEIIKDPNHEEYEERMEWLSDDFDPEAFNPEAVMFHDPKKELEWQKMIHA
ncbi:MAG: plasmid pRiA4b ORF-3 family protein [Candidatus Paracaedibacter sp.]